MTIHLRRTAAFIAAVLLALPLTACDPPQGPTGKVVAKHRHYSCTNLGSGKKRVRSCDWQYELTTRATGGRDHEFQASHHDYDACVRGATYPKCTKEAS